MKLNDFKKMMQKPIFTWADACRVAWKTSPNVLRLELFNWRKKGELTMLKRGLYLFPDRVSSKIEIARHLFSPSYVSLEWVLHQFGFLPDVVFSMTLVSPRGSKKFNTPLGKFIYHKIKKDAFWGYDPASMLAIPEKALIDYLYIYSGRLIPEQKFWDEMRWQNLNHLNFKRAKQFANRLGVQKVFELTESLENYAKT